MKKNRKLSFRLFKIISLVMLGVFIITYFANNFIAEKYLLYKNNYNLDRAYQEIGNLSMEELAERKENLQEKYKLTIVWFEYNDDEQYFNGQLRLELNKERITLNKIWLIKDTIKKLESGEKVRRLYNQGELKSSFLVNYFIKQNNVIVMGQSIAHIQDIINIINKINFVLWISTFIILLFFIGWYIKKVTKPIEKIREKSYEIANQNFSNININTGDELEELADSINIMSNKLSYAMNELDMKNARLKTLISDISHEMKTPLTLINVYAHGLLDGLNDGTYVKGIINETNGLSDLITDLLQLSKVEQESLAYSEVNINELITKIINEYRVVIKEKNVHVCCNLTEESQFINGDENKIESALKNIIYNAIKYTNDNKVDIIITEENNKIALSVINQVDNGFEKEKITELFNPFYVIDESRNKDVSGNGLGLAIVKTILDKHDMKYDIELENNKFIFTVLLKN